MKRYIVHNTSRTLNEILYTVCCVQHCIWWHKQEIIVFFSLFSQGDIRWRSCSRWIFFIKLIHIWFSFWFWPCWFSHIVSEKHYSAMCFWGIGIFSHHWLSFRFIWIGYSTPGTCSSMYWISTPYYKLFLNWSLQIQV